MELLVYNPLDPFKLYAEKVKTAVSIVVFPIAVYRGFLEIFRRSVVWVIQQIQAREIPKPDLLSRLNHFDVKVITNRGKSIECHLLNCAVMSNRYIVVVSSCGLSESEVSNVEKRAERGQANLVISLGVSEYSRKAFSTKVEGVIEACQDGFSTDRTCHDLTLITHDWMSSLMVASYLEETKETPTMKVEWVSFGNFSDFVAGHYFGLVARILRLGIQFIGLDLDQEAIEEKKVQEKTHFNRMHAP